MLTLTSLGVLFAALASGCAFRGTDANSTFPGLLTRSDDSRQGEMTGIVSGTLELDGSSGCILLSGKPVVWPKGTTVTSDPPVLHLPGGAKARTGDTIAGAGGEVPGTRIRETKLGLEGDLTSALECAPEDSAVAIFTARGEQVSVTPS